MARKGCCGRRCHAIPMCNPPVRDPKPARVFAVSLMALAAGCSHAPGTLLVRGTGSDGYYVADANGGRALTGYLATNASTSLPAGTYTVVLNGSTQLVRVRAGATVEVRAGALFVSGLGADGFYVADSGGERALTGSRTTGLAFELLPGTFTAVLNNSRQRVVVAAGVTDTVRAGNAFASGLGADGYYVADSTGLRALTGSRTTNGPFELVPGRYSVVLNNSRQVVTILPGERTEVRAGSVCVTGTGADGYYVADSTGERALTGSRNTNAPFELMPGRYTVILNNTRQLITVAPGIRSDVRAGEVALRGGTESYWIADSTGQRALTGARPATRPMELLAGSYVIRTGVRRVAVHVVSGRASSVTP